ncbi:lipase family protein [Sorangium cellulosum]|nr:lipase family protein [Sorangium cellulosum]
MSRRRLEGCDYVEISTRNDALFFDTSAVLVQSPGRKLTILSFRGTQPQNAINWLTGVSARAEYFPAGGKVHGGFQRGLRSTWPVLQELLLAALNARPICDALAHSREKYLSPCGAAKPEAPVSMVPAPITDAIPEEKELLPSLYITGHSLGGALAVLAAALLYAQADAGVFGRDRRQVRSWIRGVYTYGQPMVGDAAFASMNGDLGKKLFRHVYRRDIVPRLPPRIMGDFMHFGQQYDSSEASWMPGTRPARQAISLGLSNLVGVLSWFTQDVVPLQWVRLPFSWGDHSPLNYMRTSLEAAPGEEFD